MSSCDIEVNPDIVGIGVRISLYILALAGPTLSFLQRSKELLTAIERAMGITGFAVLLTALTYAIKHELDLFHALCIFHLVGLVGLSVKPATLEDDDDDEDSPRKWLIVLYYASIVGFVGFMIYIFARAPHLGPHPECNGNVKYVIFGINVLATNIVLRVLFLTAFGILIIFVPLATYATDSIKSFKHGVRASLENGFVRDALGASYAEAEEGKDGYVMIGEVVGRVYIITMLELMLKRNTTGSAGNDWGFGQILAMVMLVGPLIELYSGRKSKGRDISWESIFRFFAQPLIRIAVSAVDLGICAAAGAAAAATGAHASGDSVTTYIVRSGAIAGMIASGVIGVSAFITKATSSPTMYFVCFASTPFGTAFVVALAMSNRVIGETPNGILIGALVAGVPLVFGSTWNAAGDPNRSLRFLSKVPVYVVLFALMGVGFDAVGGFVFAKVAQDQGYYVCAPHVAAAAATVYSIIVWILHLPQSVVWMKMSGLPVLPDTESD